MCVCVMCVIPRPFVACSSGIRPGARARGCTPHLHLKTLWLWLRFCSLSLRTVCDRQGHTSILVGSMEVKVHSSGCGMFPKNPQTRGPTMATRDRNLEPEPKPTSSTFKLVRELALSLSLSLSLVRACAIIKCMCTQVSPQVPQCNLSNTL